MPTGYTYRVKDGTCVSLAEFAEACSHAFDHRRRDQSPYDSVDDTSEVPPFYEEALAEAEARLAEAEQISLETAERREAEEFARAEASRARLVADSRADRQRYESMLQKVQEWSPPDSLLNLKSFMIEQLLQSIKFDCHDDVGFALPERKSPSEFKQQLVEEAKREAERCSTSLKDAKRRVREIREWYAQIAQSTKGK